MMMRRAMHSPLSTCGWDGIRVEDGSGMVAQWKWRGDPAGNFKSMQLKCSALLNLCPLLCRPTMPWVDLSISSTLCPSLWSVPSSCSIWFWVCSVGKVFQRKLGTFFWTTELFSFRIEHIFFWRENGLRNFDVIFYYRQWLLPPNSFFYGKKCRIDYSIY